MPPSVTTNDRVELMTLLDSLWRRAERQPDDLAFTFLRDGEEDAVPLTYAELAERAIAIGERLRSADLSGSRVLLLFEPGLDYIAAFFGTLYAGAAAVPVYPPDPLRFSRTIPRLQAIVQESRAGAVLTNVASRGWAEGLATPDSPLICCDERPLSATARWSPADVEGDTIALLQYTSGSTAVPKGVMVSHANLMHNLRSIHDRLDRPEGVVGVTWLPPYHDLGLIAGVLLPVFSGRHAVVMSPLAFMQRPYRWLRAMSKYRAQTSGGPNFGYELCLKKISAEERRTLDLSEWIVACNGAEPIRTATLRRFAETFAECGFRPEAFYPSYGLAEATLFVSGGRRGEAAPMRQFDAAALAQDQAIPVEGNADNSLVELVGHGFGLPEQTMRIVDPATGQPRREGEVGEIWVSGPSVAQGYWNRPDETAETFAATLAGDPGRTYLRTGDLGFLLDGELYITGRLKDLIIVAGRNLYPQDLEQTAAAAHPALKADGGAAFAVETAASEGVVIVQEVQRPKKVDADAVTAAIRTAIAESHGIDLEAVVLIKPGTLPKTSSGKVQRGAARDLFLNRQLVEVARWSQEDALAIPDDDGTAVDSAAVARMCRIWEQTLDVEQVHPDESFLHAGGTSLLATELLMNVQRELVVDVDFADLIAAPTPRQLSQRLAGRRTTTNPSSETADDGQLSAGQQALWQIQQRDPASSGYHLAFAVETSGPVDRDRLRDALNAVVARHDGLRTTFEAMNGKPRRVVHAALAADVGLIEIPPGATAEHIEQLCAEAVKAPFDLGTGPLLRCRVMALQGDAARLLFVFHHIAVDGWSLPIIARELLAAYSGEASGLPARPAPTLAAYVRWQQDYLESETASADAAYWQQELEALPPLRLPGESPALRVTGTRGRQRHFVLDADVSSRMKSFAERQGVTPTAVMFAAWQMLLARLSGQCDFGVGTVVAGRTKAEQADLVGFLANTVVVRSSTAAERTAADVLADVSRRLQGALAHQCFPFEETVRLLRSAGAVAAGAEPVRALFVSQGFTPALNELLNQGLAIRELDNGHVKFDLVLQVSEQADHWLGRIGLRDGVLDDAAAASLVPAFAAILTHLIEAPDEAWDRRPLAQRSNIPHEAAVSGEWTSIVERFAAVAEQHGDRVAVRGNGRSLTYAELNRAAEQVARALRQRSLGAEAGVVVVAERTPEWLIAVWGVWKAGAVYVPVDPQLPPARRRQLIETAEASLVLHCGASGAEVHDIGHAISVMELLEDAEHGHAIAANVILPEQAAYLIFTSGSTGEPKGVVIEHRGLPYLADAQMEAFQLSPGTRVLPFASPGFDASISEMVTTLLAGGTLCLADPDRLAAPDELATVLERDAIHVVTLPPSIWRRLPEGSYQSLKTAVSAGEACAEDVVRRWSPGRRLINAYGPSEATVCATMHVFSAPEWGVPPIGRPLPGFTIRVADRHGADVPAGFPGELWLSGPAIARGYWQRPQETNAAFVTDDSGRRWYRTGDRVVERGDGALVYLGRIDEQIKRYGVRIEPGEIETVLRGHAQIQDAAILAIATDDEASPPALVACVVTEGEATLSPEDLRTWLSERLPASHVPSTFSFRPELPRTSSGKIDRRQLVADVQADFTQHADQADWTPATALEVQLSDFWAESLGHRRFDGTTNFFVVGGDSIRAATLVSRLQNWLGEYVYPTSLFDAPTLGELADYLRRTYPESLSIRCPGEPGLVLLNQQAHGIGAEDLQRFRALIPARPPSPPRRRRNPAAMFLLSAPRSGSTLLRAMLAGHPQLFAPPELELLSFATMQQREAELSGRFAFWKEGLIRAVMNLKDCDAESAGELVAEMLSDNLAVADVYAILQDWAAPRMLVDKTPAYALDRSTLDAAEATFEQPLYVHLVRHPAAVVRSFVEARLEQVFFRPAHDWSAAELAELVWNTCEQNIQQFLSTIPAERRFQLTYESLVADPRGAMQSLCEHFGWPFDERLLTPYDDPQRRMTDGVHPLSKMLGDVKFHTHQQIDGAAADRWRPAGATISLSDVTRTTAAVYDYPLPAAPPRLPKLVAGEQAGPAPLSFPQQRLWFLDQLERDNPFYNICTAIRLEGPFDADHFDAALQLVLERHEPLRTCIQRGADQQPQQVVQSGIEIRAQRIELDGNDWQPLALEEARRPFAVDEMPLLRCLILREAADRHVVVLTMHHIAADGWSMGVLMRDLTTAYEALARNVDPAWRPLTVQYRDYARWQRQPQVEQHLRQQLEYWESELGDLPDLRLPTDRPRPRTPRFQGRRLSFALDAAVQRGLLDVSQQAAATPFMTALATFEVMLARWSGQSDFGVGMGIAGRNDHALEDLVGFFANTLVIRSDATPDRTFRDLLTAVRQRVLSAYAHQDVPFEWLIEQLQPERQRNVAPLFQAAIVFQNMPLEQRVAEGLTLTRLDLDNGSSKYDLTLYIWPSASGWLCTIEYDTDLFDGETIARFRDGWLTLLHAVTANPEQRVGELPVVGPTEATRISTDFAAGDPLEGEQQALDVFADWVAQTPEAIAVSDDVTAWSYARLDHESNRIAAGLQARGIGAEDVVAVALPRGADSMAVILGILKAGAAFLPLDLRDGPHRLSFLLREAQCRLLIAGSASAELAEAANVPQATPEELAAAAATDLRRTAIAPEHLAYVIYTSGSTGRPKGVMATHRGLSLLVAAQRQVFELPPECRTLQAASPAFDASVFEAWLAWGAGGTLVIADDNTRAGGRPLAGLLKQESISVATLTPSVLATIPVGDYPALQTLICAGEALPRDLAEQWSVGRRVINAYGPTETTVWSTWSEFDPRRPGPPPIGRPVPGFEACVLDSAGRPVPIGTPGELGLSGPALARGYRQRPGETAQRFVPNADGARIYRTGDLVRWNNDGQLTYLGRIDRQIKRHGQRIEPAEIEAQLGEHPQVAKAAVRATSTSERDVELTAYVVPRESDGESPDDRRCQQVAQWRTLYDAVFDGSTPGGDPRFPIAGWRRRDTGEPFTEREMRDWAGQTVQRILAEQPRRILEIGCGAGLLGFSLIEHVEQYAGLDLSAAMLNHFRQQLTPREAAKTWLAVAAADQLHETLAAWDWQPDRQAFDVIVLNSVVQYFPDADYLAAVLDAARDWLAPHGTIFVGDVRSYAQRRAQYAEIALAQPGGPAGAEQLRRHIAHLEQAEPELLLDPAWFRRWGEPEFGAMFLLKTGDFAHELTRFRYDVVLRRSTDETRDAVRYDRFATGDADAETRLAELAAAYPDRVVEVTGVIDDAVAPGHRLLEAISASDRLEPEASRRAATLQSRTQLATLAKALERPLALIWDDADPTRLIARLAPQGRPEALIDRGRSRGEAAGDHNTPCTGSHRAAALEGALADWLAERLPAAWRPEHILAVPRIPLTPRGKIDWAALPLPESLSQPAAAYVPPADDLERELAAMWEAELGKAPIGVTESFFDLGGHSLMAVRLMDRIQQRYPGRLPLAVLFEEPTIRHLAAVLREQDDPGAQGLLIPLQRSGEKTPLFLLHPAGGTVFCYVELARRMGVERPIYALQAEGLSPGTAPHRTLPEMVESYLAEIRRVQPSGPYHLAGWSLGGNLAFAVTQALRQEGQPVGLLAVLDAGVFIPGDGEPDEEVLAAALSRMFPDEGAKVWQTLRELKRTEQEAWFRDHAERCGVLLPAQSPQLIKQAYRVFRYNLKAVSEYIPPRYDGEIALCVTGRQESDAVQQMIEGWEQLAPGRVSSRVIDERHMDLLKPPTVRDVAAFLHEHLRRFD